MNTRWARLVITTLVLLAGCSHTDSGRPVETGTRTSTSAAPDQVAWMEQLCGTVHDLSFAIWGSASDSDPTGAEALRRSFAETLESAHSALADGVDLLGELGQAPVDGGDQAVRDLVGKLTQLQQEVATATSELDSLPRGSTEDEVGRVMGSTWPKVTAMAGKPYDGIEITQAMRDAGSGPRCTGPPTLPG